MIDAAAAATAATTATNNNNYNYNNPAGHGVKIKEGETIDKYLDLARDLIKQWNMRGTVIPIIVGALGTVPKDLQSGVKELEIRG